MRNWLYQFVAKNTDTNQFEHNLLAAYRFVKETEDLEALAKINCSVYH
jgi:hypothetical protein